MKLLAAILAAAALAAAQTPVPAAFDAATIKPWAPPANGRGVVGFQFSPERMTIAGLPLKLLIQQAWKLRPDQIQGPDWLSSERFDVTAETQQPLTDDQMVALLRPFLIQQFQLKTHTETKPESVYALVIADSGLKIKPPGPNGVLMPPPPPGAPARRARLTGRPLPPGSITTTAISPQSMTLVGSPPMDSLAATLSNMLGRPVVDMTKLTGDYEMHLTFAPPPGLGRGRRRAEPAPPSASDAEPTAPSIFVALPEQLGLKLDPRKLPTEILVIDSASKSPIGN